MSKKKYYAVKVGHKTGIFENVDEYNASMQNFKAPEGKGFATKEEAEAYLNGTLKIPKKKRSNDGNRKQDLKNLPEKDQTTGIAYIDGCYNPETDTLACAGIILRNNKVLEKFRDKIVDEFWVEGKNVSGEIAGCIRALKRISKLGFKKAKIYTDYKPLKDLADGKATPDAPNTKKFVQEIKEYKKKGLQIEIIAIESHSGIKYNELADEMAKKSAGIK